MPKFRVTEYYLATGMEGIPIQNEYGIIEAETAKDAKIQVIKTHYPNIKDADKRFILGCLSAEEVLRV